MLNYEDIVDAPVGKLKAAADDWSEMAGKLEKLADDAADGMKVKADKANWEGLNAGVTKAFVGKTAKEFADAAAEAKGVKMILDEGHTAIKKAKDDLVNIRDHEGPAAGIRVDGRGKVFARHPVEDLPPQQKAHDPDYPALVQQQKENIASWQKKIDLIVDNCNDTDVSFKNSLEANVTDRKDFNAPKYTKMDQEEAARAAGLAAKGRDITHTELQQLNELLKDNAKSPEFSKNFYEKLGPEKSLAFFGQLSTDTYEYGKVDKERLKDVQELQKNLGLNLATASHDKDFSEKWGPELRKMGTERIPLAKHDYNGPYGYQLLGGIMRYGNYDKSFLNPIAEHVAQLHQKDPYMFADNKVVNSPFKNPFNPSGVNGAGYDPATAMLEALGNSPDAAKHFFNDPPTAYNEDGTVDKGATADLGKNGETPIDNYLDFFGNEKWESFPDVNSLDEDELKNSLNQMPDALGHALESATLGYPAGHPDASVVRDADNAAVMQQVMEKYGADSRPAQGAGGDVRQPGHHGRRLHRRHQLGAGQGRPGQCVRPQGLGRAHRLPGRRGGQERHAGLPQRPRSASGRLCDGVGRGRGVHAECAGEPGRLPRSDRQGQCPVGRARRRGGPGHARPVPGRPGPGRQHEEPRGLREGRGQALRVGRVRRGGGYRRGRRLSRPPRRSERPPCSSPWPPTRPAVGRSSSSGSSSVTCRTTRSTRTRRRPRS